MVLVSFHGHKNRRVGLIVLVSFHKQMHRGMGLAVLVSFNEHINRRVRLIVLVSFHKQMHTQPCGTEVSFLSEGYHRAHQYLKAHPLRERPRIYL